MSLETCVVQEVWRGKVWAARPMRARPRRRRLRRPLVPARHALEGADDSARPAARGGSRRAAGRVRAPRRLGLPRRRLGRRHARPAPRGRLARALGVVASFRGALGLVRQPPAAVPAHGARFRDDGPRPRPDRRSRRHRALEGRGRARDVGRARRVRAGAGRADPSRKESASSPERRGRPDGKNGAPIPAWELPELPPRLGRPSVRAHRPRSCRRGTTRTTARRDGARFVEAARRALQRDERGRDERRTSRRAVPLRRPRSAGASASSTSRRCRSARGRRRPHSARRTRSRGPDDRTGWKARRARRRAA